MQANDSAILCNLSWWIDCDTFDKNRTNWFMMEATSRLVIRHSELKRLNEMKSNEIK